MTSSAKDIAQALRDANVEADYVFYFAYLSPKSGKSAMDPDTAKELVETNVPLFENFLSSLPIAVYPFAIIGATEHASMNMFLSFGVYAAIQAQRGEPLKFGADFTSWQFKASHSTARLTGYLSEWVVLEEKCAKQSFSSSDGGLLSRDRFSMSWHAGTTSPRYKVLSLTKVANLVS
ncbi:hypothetical protein EJ07DRAFT_155896 [Lizonia empirigonia]|nr:hypothetical protein EJ07DRAFT_155896 [Lizonia empirigonia]